MYEIQIRQAETSDAQALRDLYAMPGAQGGTLQLPYPTLAMWQKRLSERAGHGLVAIVDGLLVGDLGLWLEPNPRRRHVGGIGMGVRDDWTGRGVGSALLGAAVDLADNWLNLQRLELTVYSDNAAAIALYRKFGFEQEGCSPAYAFRQGLFVDALHMGRVRLP
ncbi:GNAT family N-acetyltransferase [Aeromonas molluscorum]|jgi:L-phenylalanine/L-methionine N-acetyltransferase|uniref:Acetyltransferase n=1 Tax=Aeromonas molluscorum 848 TaxID=1268236 RepID=R1F7N6_9GAMM|nr:GNAT family N-acetyltransferase [Aeromonas molluscorum]EOD55752.1 acetyltransferase [Aeromonas molluscorum 848]